MTLNEAIRQVEREAALALMNAHGLEILGPKGGIYYIMDSATDEPIKGYGLYGNAVKAAKRIAEKRCEPKPSELSETEIAESLWSVTETPTGEFYVTHKRMRNRGRPYPTLEKATRRMKTLICRELGVQRAREAV